MYYVNDMEKAVKYYKLLGFIPTQESPDWTEFAVSGHNLCLHQKKPGESYPQGGILIFNSEGIKSLFDRLKAQELDVHSLHQVHPQAWTFHLRDIDGNETSFYGSP